jgi:chemotaxis protein histidine kinase CheA
MLHEIKNQFFYNTIKELQSISIKLSAESILSEDFPMVIHQVYQLTHQISGTGPMLGFVNTSKLSRKIEKTFLDITTSKKELSLPIVLQTRRAVDSMIQTMNDEFDKQPA